MLWRLYHPVGRIDKALEWKLHLMRLKNIKYDADVVEACLKIKKEPSGERITG